MDVMEKRLNALVDENIALGMPGADLAVYKNGKCIYRYMTGTSREDGTPMKGNERYNIYSNSKIITCVVALKLWEEGKFSLDDKVSRFFPEYENMNVLENGVFHPAETKMLMKHLFTMSSGFRYDTNHPSVNQVVDETGGHASTREIVRAFAGIPLAFNPGSRFLYGLSHDVLAAVVEDIAGMKFSEYVKKAVFDPLEMTASTFALPESERDTVCDLYKYNPETKKSVKCVRNFQIGRLGSDYESGGAGCVSSVDDYIKLLEALRTGTILKESTVDMMTTNSFKDSQLANLWVEGYGYGLGVRCPKDSTKHDFGWGGAAGSFAVVDREMGISAFYCQHVLGHPITNRTDIPAIIRGEDILRDTTTERPDFLTY